MGERDGQLWPVLLGAAAAGGALWLAPGSFDAERWSLYAPALHRAAGWLVGGYVLLLAAVVWRLGPEGWWTACLAPVALAAPAVLVKPLVTDLRGLLAGEQLARGLQIPLVLLLAGLAAAAVGSGNGRRAAAAGVWTALVGMILWAGLRFGELEQQEAVVASGRVESLLSELALAVGEDTAAHGRPSADGGRWLRERLRAPGWDERDGLWFWAPRAGVGPGAVRLRYLPPEEEAGPATVVLRSVDVAQVSPGARPFRAEIALDGAFSCFWPQGPPAAVTAAREAAP